MNVMSSQPVFSGSPSAPAFRTRRNTARRGVLRAHLRVGKAGPAHIPAPDMTGDFRPKKAKVPAPIKGSGIYSAMPTGGSLPAGDRAALFCSPGTAHEASLPVRSALQHP